MTVRLLNIYTYHGPIPFLTELASRKGSILDTKLYPFGYLNTLYVWKIHKLQNYGHLWVQKQLFKRWWPHLGAWTLNSWHSYDRPLTKHNTPHWAVSHLGLLATTKVPSNYIMDVFSPLIGHGGVNGSRMECTLELTGGRGTGIQDVTGLQKKYGCSAADVKTISRLEHGRPGTFEVGFAGLTSLNKFLPRGGEGFSYRTRSFSCVNLGNQNVTIRSTGFQAISKMM